MIKTGDTYSEKVVFTRDMADAFLKIIGDANPIHTDIEAAKKAGYSGIVVNGMFAASMFDRVFGSVFPGYGTINMQRELTFIRPVFLGQEYMMLCEVTEIDGGGGIGIIKLMLKDVKGRSCITGTAKLKNTEQFILFERK
jgi:acyl dehydratase